MEYIEQNISENGLPSKPTNLIYLNIKVLKTIHFSSVTIMI